MDSRCNYIAMFCTYQNASQSNDQALNNNHNENHSVQKRDEEEERKRVY